MKPNRHERRKAAKLGRPSVMKPRDGGKTMLPLPPLSYYAGPRTIEQDRARYMSFGQEWTYYAEDGTVRRVDPSEIYVGWDIGCEKGAETVLTFDGSLRSQIDRIADTSRAKPVIIDGEERYVMIIDPTRMAER